MLLLLPAAAPAREEDGEVRWYEVEVVLFAPTDAEAARGERWPLDPGAPLMAGAVELQPPPAPAPGLEGPPRPPGAFQSLPPAQRRLTPLVDRLRRDPRYKVLRHLAWRQPEAPRAAAPAVAVHPRAGAVAAGLGPEPGDAGPVRPPFYGILRLGVGRYLHLEADLVRWTTLPVQPRPGEWDLALAEATRTGAVRLHQSRRMRSGELHYLDHPLMGLLVLVSRMETPPPSPVEEGVEEPRHLGHARL